MVAPVSPVCAEDWIKKPGMTVESPGAAVTLATATGVGAAVGVLAAATVLAAVTRTAAAARTLNGSVSRIAGNVLLPARGGNKTLPAGRSTARPPGTGERNIS